MIIMRHTNKRDHNVPDMIDRMVVMEKIFPWIYMKQLTEYDGTKNYSVAQICVAKS